MTQYARPTSTIEVGDWIPSSNLHLEIDNAATEDSTDARVNTGNYGYELPMTVGLGAVTDPESSADHKVFLRKRALLGWGTIELNVKLYQIGTPDVLIVSFQADPGANSSWVDKTQTLTTGQANTITDYSALKIRVIAYDGEEGSDHCLISQMYFECPDAAASSTALPMAMNTYKQLRNY